MSRFASICPALIALLALTAPSPAAAQTSAALMPSTGGHREIPDSVREEATRAALEYLRTEDLAVLAPTFVVEVLDEAQRACAPNTDCMSDVRGALGVELLAGLILWGSAEARASPRTVHATLLDASGVRYLGTAEVARGVPTAVRDALRAAREAQRRGPGPFLDVAGTRGAIAELDGAALGSLPLEAVRVEPGEHQLRVHLEGYETQTLTVAIGDDPSRTTRVEVELQPSGGGQPGRPPGAGLALSDWAIPVGVGATVAGAGLAVAVPLVSLAMTGCTEETGGACVSSDQFAVGANVAWIIGGGALAIVGVALTIVGATADGGGEVRARVGPGHFSIEGSF